MLHLQNKVVTHQLNMFFGINSNYQFNFIKTTTLKSGGFFLYICTMEKEHQIFGIRAIIEAIQAGKEVDKV